MGFSYIDQRRPSDEGRPLEGVPRDETRGQRDGPTSVRPSAPSSVRRRRDLESESR